MRDLRDRLIFRKGRSEASWSKKKKGGEEKKQWAGTIDLEAFFYLSGWTCGSWCSSRPMVRGRDSNLLVLQISSSVTTASPLPPLQPTLSPANPSHPTTNNNCLIQQAKMAAIPFYFDICIKGLKDHAQWCYYHHVCIAHMICLANQKSFWKKSLPASGN